MRSPAMALLLGVLTIVSWGLWGFFGKLALSRGLPVASQIITSGLVAALACIILLIVYLRTGGALTLQGSPNLWAILTGLALVAGLVTFYGALSVGEATVIVPLTGTYPIFTVLLSLVFLGERLTIMQWLGIVLVVLGIVLLGAGTATTPGEASPGS